MKTSLFVRFILLVFVTVAFVSNSSAQDSPQWSLPDGAKARLGKGVINEIQYSPDGTRLAVASGIGIWLYDTATHQEVALLAGHMSAESAAFSPDGHTLASRSGNTIQFWDTDTGELLRTLNVSDWVDSVTFSPDGRAIASSTIWDFPGDEGVVYTIRLWDADTGEILRTLSGHTGPVESVAFSPDGHTVASGSGGWDDTVRVWDATTGELLHTLNGHFSIVDSIAFSSDGKNACQRGLFRNSFVGRCRGQTPANAQAA